MIPASGDASETPDASFMDLPDLASERLGGAVIAANDEFFAAKEGLTRLGAPEWREGAYTERGKWMDGWETRRRRTPGHDWAIIRLGVSGIVRGVVIDTSFFTGNFPEHASVDACAIGGTPSADSVARSQTPWEPLLAPSPLNGNSQNLFAIDRHAARVTHLRLNIFPDGGIARLRVHGDVLPDPRLFEQGREVDLAAMESGGFVVACSDMHYGHRQNLILPGRSTHMGDGWETKRRRGPGHDWSIIRLARRGSINRIEIDTDHYKGNAPGSCTVECIDAEKTGGVASITDSVQEWSMLLGDTPLQPHSRHRFESIDQRAATHVRLSIYPDGGVARLRLIGTAAPQ